MDFRVAVIKGKYTVRIHVDQEVNMAVSNGVLGLRACSVPYRYHIVRREILTEC